MSEYPREHDVEGATTEAAEKAEAQADEQAEAHHHALVGLHALSGTFGDRDPRTIIPGFRVASPEEDLRQLAAAPIDQVRTSARLDILYQLARKGFSEDDATKAAFRELAQSAVQGRDVPVDVDDLIRDLNGSSRRNTPFRMTESARKLQHHETAFIGEDICTVKTVRVGGMEATWIFSEFETDADFDHVAEWANPFNWPKWGPLFFKKMQLVGASRPLNLGRPGDPHWHGVFHEKVQLLRPLNTLLHCDYWREGNQAAGMTYELNHSVDGEIDVDRGYLLVNETNGRRRVRALKIVGFTNDIWDVVAQFVCPFWTDWARGAVEGANDSSGKPASQAPPTPSPLGDTVESWIDFFGDSARTYARLFDDVGTQVSAGSYTSADFVKHGKLYWSQLAKDWAKAWVHGLETLGEVAESGLDAGFTPPGVLHERGKGAASAMTTPAAANPVRPERSIFPVAGLTASDRPVVSDLVSIEAGAATIPSKDITVTVEASEAGASAVLLRTTNSTVAPGLYVGYLQGGPGAARTPVQLYISRATEA